MDDFAVKDCLRIRGLTALAAVFGLVVLQRWLWRLLCRIWGVVAPTMKITVSGLRCRSANYEDYCVGFEVSYRQLWRLLCRVWSFTALRKATYCTSLEILQPSLWRLLCWVRNLTALNTKITVLGFEAGIRWLKEREPWNVWLSRCMPLSQSTVAAVLTLHATSYRPRCTKSGFIYWQRSCCFATCRFISEPLLSHFN
jgi:hypothetical protein